MTTKEAAEFASVAPETVKRRQCHCAREMIFSRQIPQATRALSNKEAARADGFYRTCEGEWPLHVHTTHTPMGRIITRDLGSNLIFTNQIDGAAFGKVEITVEVSSLQHAMICEEILRQSNIEKGRDYEGAPILTWDEMRAVRCLHHHTFGEDGLHAAAYDYIQGDEFQSYFGECYAAVFPVFLQRFGFSETEVAAMRPDILQSAYAAFGHYPNLEVQTALNVQCWVATQPVIFLDDEE